MSHTLSRTKSIKVLCAVLLVLTACRRTKPAGQQKTAAEQKASLISSSTDPVPAAQHTHYRGNPERTGQSQFKGPDKGYVCWRYATSGRITGGPVLTADGGIVVGSHDHHLYLLNPDGTLRWKRDLDARIYASALVTQAGDIVVGSDGGWIWAWSSDGTLKWKLPVDGDADTPPVQAHAQSSAPGMLYMAAGHSIYAITTEGVVRWRVQLPGKCYSGVALGPDNTLYVGSQDDHLYAIEPGGTIKWVFSTEADIDSTPLLAGDGIYVGSDDHHVYALTFQGQLRWKHTLTGYIRGSLALGKNNDVIVGQFGPDVSLSALSRQDGHVLWTTDVARTPSDVVGLQSAPLVDAEGHIFIGTPADRIVSLSPTGKVIWQVPTAGDVDASGALSGDKVLYIGSDDGFLYAICGLASIH